MGNIQVLLIAAGASKRMGKPKQLLPWGGGSLVEHQIKVLLETKKPLSLVLGAYADKIIPLIEKFSIAKYRNEDWEKGMGTSIAYGVKKLLDKDPTVDGVLISLIDQPLIQPAHFKKMLKLFQPGKKQIIVSKSKDGWSGAPVLFDAVYFKELQKLKGDEGAKKIIQKESRNVTYVNASNLLTDIDTPDSYHKMIQTLFN